MTETNNTLQKAFAHNNNRSVALSLRVAHINDTHSNFDPSTVELKVFQDRSAKKLTLGGFARLKTAIEQARAEAELQQEGFLALHSGDCFQGTLYFNLYKGKANAEFLNALHLDAMTLGNHEFDLGNERLAEFAELAQFPMLVANLNLANESATKKKPLASNPNIYRFDHDKGVGQFLIRTFNGVSVAVMGITVEDMHSISNPDPDSIFELPITTLKGMIAEAHKMGIYHIVVVSHLGYQADRALAEAVDGVGLIVGGHTHQLLGDFRDLGLGFTGEYAEIINGTAVVQAGCNALALGQIQTHWDQEGNLLSVSGGNQLLMDESSLLALESHERFEWQLALKNHPRICWVAPDPNIEERLKNHYRPKTYSWHQDVVAHIHEPLRHVRIPDAKGSSQICPTVARALCWQMEQIGQPVDFGVHNAGGTRTSLGEGPLSAGDVTGKLLPFVLNIGRRAVTGEQLRWALEGAIDVALAQGGNNSGSFPYTHGLYYELDFTAPYGNRVLALQINKNGVYQPIHPEQLYQCATNAYTGSGKEGYDALAQGGAWYQVNIPLAEVFINYAREHKSIAKAENPVLYGKRPER